MTYIDSQDMEDTLTGSGDPDGFDERNKHIISMYARGFNHREIAEVVGISRSRVSIIIKGIKREWKKDFLREFNVVVNQQLATIDAIEAEAWDSWERSKIATRVLTEKVGVDGDKTIDFVQNESRVTELGDLAEMPGDAKFLKIVQDCVSQRARIFGFFAKDVRDKTKDEKASKEMSEMAEAIKSGVLAPEAVQQYFPDEAKEIFKMAGRDIFGNPI